jgi:sugar phosphate isomerase/epimerase
MILNRREWLATGATGLAALRCLPSEAGTKAAGGPKRLGVVTYSYGLRLAADRASGIAGLADPLAFLEHCHRQGAGGIQHGIGIRDKPYTAKLREKVEAYQMFLEGSVRLPQDRADVERFDNEVRIAKEVGATVLRTVLLTGRRYETFATATAFRQWADRSYQSLVLAEPVAARHDVRLAVENHKDYRAGELVEILKRLSSRHVGACVDTGNNLALLEDPLETVETLAPWAYTTHLKDMGVKEYEDGFLLAEVPLGEGILDLKKIVGILRRARPEIRFNLEMITRDPLKIPCLTPKYWTTFENLPGRYLAQTLALVRQRKASQPLPRVSGLTREQQLSAEENNVQKCLAYARKHLEL